MTRTGKLLSLVLLTGMAMGTFAQRKKDRGPDHSKERASFKEHSEKKELCCECCKSSADFCDKQCKTKDLCLSFKTCLSFEQTLFFIPGNGPQPQEGPLMEGLPQIIPRDPQDKPSEDACGTFEICFAEDFSQARYKLQVSGLDPETNPNQLIQGALLCFGDARTPVNIVKKDDVPEFPIIAPLLGLDLGGTGVCGGRASICDEGILTNDDLREFGFGQDRFIPTLRSVYELCRQELVFAIIFGNSVCDPSKAKYGFDVGGMLRGQLSGKQTSGTFFDFSSDLPGPDLSTQNVATPQEVTPVTLPSETVTDDVVKPTA